mgnify:CR=1 FL=1
MLKLVESYSNCIKLLNVLFLVIITTRTSKYESGILHSLGIINLDRNGFNIVADFKSQAQCHFTLNIIIQFWIPSHLNMLAIPGHIKNIPTMQFFTGISRNTQSNWYITLLTVCIWEFKNNAL